MSDRRKGKVARLPWAVRNVVGEKLRDGLTYAAVAAWLDVEGHAGITEDNVRRWAAPDEKGECGYNDWLRERERLEDMSAKREFALNVVNQNQGSTVHEAALQVAASQLYELITEFDLGNLKRVLNDKPERFTSIVDSLTRLSAGGLDYAKYRDQVSERKARIEAEIDAAKNAGGLTSDTLDKIERELRLL